MVSTQPLEKLETEVSLLGTKRASLVNPNKGSGHQDSGAFPPGNALCVSSHVDARDAMLS